MKEYAIEGHDGSAKTPIAEQVKAKLLGTGISTEICSPFQIVNSRITEPDIFVYWSTPESAKKGIQLLETVIDEAREQARVRDTQVVLYDRHWLTILRCLQIVPQTAKQRIDWNTFLPTFFIEAPPEKTMDCKRLSSQVPWTANRSAIETEYFAFLSLAEQYSSHICSRYRVESRTQPLGPIVNSITNYILQER